MGRRAHHSYGARERPGRLGLKVDTMVRWIVLAGLAASFPVMAQGQGRGMIAAGAHPGAVAPRVTTHAAQPAVAQAMPVARMAVRSSTVRARTATTPTARITRRPNGTRRHIDVDDITIPSSCGTVPGLGFDEPHLAATCGPAAVGAGRHGRRTPFFFPIFDGGFFLPSSPVIVEEGAAPAPQPEATDEEAAADAPERRKVSQAAPARTAETANAAPQEAEQFVFVRRDGTVFFAVAYVWENGALRYITSEGLRRTVAQDALDLAAPQQYNEQRGLNFRLHACALLFCRLR